MRVFLTGGTGFIGHYVAKKLIEQGHEISIATRHPDKIPSLKGTPGVTMVESALLDLTSLERGLKGCDACIHIALGWGETPFSMLENDTRATVQILELAAMAGCKKFIYTSSTAAMGKMRPVMNETVANLPIDLYGATKAAGEAYVLGFRQGYGNKFSSVEMSRNIIRPGYTFEAAFLTAVLNQIADLQKWLVQLKMAVMFESLKMMELNSFMHRNKLNYM